MWEVVEDGEGAVEGVCEGLRVWVCGGAVLEGMWVEGVCGGTCRALGRGLSEAGEPDREMETSLICCSKNFSSSSTSNDTRSSSVESAVVRRGWFYRCLPRSNTSGRVYKETDLKECCSGRGMASGTAG